MIKLSGLLTIKSITGRNGPFSIGRLVTELGEFTVKDTLLEQYDPGKYEGDFGISRIYPFSYAAAGGVRVEIRACIETIALAGIEKLTAEEENAQAVESDPLDETPVVAAVRSITSDTPGKTEIDASQEREPSGDDGHAVLGLELFGDAWPLGSRVKLDPTVDRALFCSQRDLLKSLGYRFQAVGQVWINGAANEEHSAAA
jgi:hypothetical protein